MIIYPPALSLLCLHFGTCSGYGLAAPEAFCRLFKYNPGGDWQMTKLPLSESKIDFKLERVT